MRFFLSSLFCICLFLTACSSSEQETHEAPPKSATPPPIEAEDSRNIEPITARSAYIEVFDWFDESSVLYLEETKEQSTLFAYELLTGNKETLFKKENGWIASVQANADHRLFAVEVIDSFNRAALHIVDREGTTQMVIDDVGESYSVYWNPYVTTQFLLVAYLPDWQYDLFFVDVENEKMLSLNPVQTYFQWLSETKASYLNWSETEPSYHAPLYEIDVRTGEVTKKFDELIAFMSFPHHLAITVSIQSIYDQYTTYTFYKGESPIQQLEIPILNTYSEQMWTPFYAYDSKGEIFYYLRPKYSADYIRYEDGFELTAFHIKSGAEERLTELTADEPLNISPNGEWLLIGSRYERAFHIPSKQMFPLVVDDE